jgi:non-homologous end joining protein Ku
MPPPRPYWKGYIKLGPMMVTPAPSQTSARADICLEPTAIP